MAAAKEQVTDEQNLNSSAALMRNVNHPSLSSSGASI